MEYRQLMQISHLRGKLHEEEIKFLNRMQNFMGTPLYLYGSLFRFDYLYDKSDLDLFMTTSHFHTAVTKLTQFLGIDYSQVKYVKIEDKRRNRAMYGYKVKYHYESENHSKTMEIYIHNKIDKEFLRDTHYRHMQVNQILIFCLFLLKYCHAYFFLPTSVLSYLKRHLFNLDMEQDSSITYLGEL